MNILELSEQEILRRQSLDQLRQAGIDPYPAAEYTTNAFSTEILDTFHDDAPTREVSIAGRMMSRRIMGKASFVELQDSKGSRCCSNHQPREAHGYQSRAYRSCHRWACCCRRG